MLVAQLLGKALRSGFRAARVGVFIAGVEIPHAHIHLIPVEPEVYRIGFDFMDEDEFQRRGGGAGQSADPSPAEYEEAAAIVRGSLKELGFEPRPWSTSGRAQSLRASRVYPRFVEDLEPGFEPIQGHRIRSEHLLRLELEDRWPSRGLTEWIGTDKVRFSLLTASS
jgi:hypothetical protein